MTPQERQAALDNISQEDLAKIQRLQGDKIKVEPEDIVLAEFAMKFGWNAYKDARDDVITGKEMSRLLAASRKLDALEVLRKSQAAFIGSVSAQAKKPSQAFSSATQGISRSMEVDK